MTSVCDMGYFRLRKSVGLAKLVRVNLAKTGVSVSLGPRGATFNQPLISTRKRRSKVTVGLPGSGLSYQMGVSRAVAIARLGGVALAPARAHHRHHLGVVVDR
jgi:hypothetical protein